MYTIYEVAYGDPNEPSTITSRTEINVNHHIKFGKFGEKTDMFTHDAMEGLQANEVKVPAGTKKYYEILIWLNEKSNDVTTDNGEGNQDAEQGLTYTGVVNVTVSGASDKITGTIGQ